MPYKDLQKAKGTRALYRAAHREQFRAYTAKYRAQDPEKYRKDPVEWAQKHGFLLPNNGPRMFTKPPVATTAASQRRAKEKA